MARIIVFHSYYGCDTGCCGHTVELKNDDGTTKEHFEFGGPSYNFATKEAQSAIDFAKELVRDHFGEEHVKDLDWEHCNVLEDC